MPKRWPQERTDELIARWNRGEKRRAIRDAMGITSGQLASKVVKHNLTRHSAHRVQLHRNHPALVEGRSLFPSGVTEAGNILKTGAYQTKIGAAVTKGKWSGMPIYAVTLEERATCPRGCALWKDCYGNNMHFAKRMRHGPALEARMWREFRALQAKHRRGFVVRAHVLGDFYSSGYVGMWREAMAAFPALHVFGYTAWPVGTKQGNAVHALRDEYWDRFAIRTSGSRQAKGSFVVETEADVPAGAILCPVQTGKTRSCGTCALCWAMPDKPVAFLKH